MGSSRGGFAAIAFSKLLKCDLVLAYAPQANDTMKQDPRFAETVRNLEWVYPICETSTEPGCLYWDQ
jgi:hypothetical protein